MTKRKPRAIDAASAVAEGIAKERARRGNELKPIEVLKIGLGSYLSYMQNEPDPEKWVDDFSDDRKSLLRGTMSAVDRMLFNANYWRAAYEDRILAISLDAADANACLKALSTWNSHPLKLNTLSGEEVIATFERFCPPFAHNHRRGSERSAANTGPLPNFKQVIHTLEDCYEVKVVDRLHALTKEMEEEAARYDALRDTSSLEALFDILPVWCLQSRLELVSGPWWDDSSTITVIAKELYDSFLTSGYPETLCRYFLDACRESIDAYHQHIAIDPDPLAGEKLSCLLERVEEARDAIPAFEIDGYGDDLPLWLIGKEQLVWNVLVCAIYGPACARPLLVDSPSLLTNGESNIAADVITGLAHTSFARYMNDRLAYGADIDYSSFQQQPPDLKDSSIAFIASIPEKIATLGYHVLPKTGCYPERRIETLTPSEIECLAILEHRRWLKERTDAGWKFDAVKNVERKRSPYLAPWEDLPDRAKEWNRSAVRSIPDLLDSAGLTIAR